MEHGNVDDFVDLFFVKRLQLLIKVADMLSFCEHH